MSVLERLVQGGDGGNAAGSRTDVAEPEASIAEREETVNEEPAEGETKTAAVRAREILAGASGLETECTKIAAELRSEMEKTASEGGEDSGQEETASLFEKIAMTLRVQRAYAESLRKQGEANARTCEALKVASDLMQRDLLEVGEGQSMADAVDELSKKDLKAVKVASEMFKEAALTNALGAAEKIASDKNPNRKLDGSMESWAEAHSWLYQ